MGNKKTNGDAKFWISWVFSQFYISFEIFRNEKNRKKNQENEKIEINYFNTDHLIVSK